MKQLTSEIQAATNHIKNSLNGISIDVLEPDLTDINSYKVEVIYKDKKNISFNDVQGLPAIISITIVKLVINSTDPIAKDELVFDVNIHANSMVIIEQIIKEIASKFKSILSSGDLVFLFEYPASPTPYSIIANTTMLAKGKFNIISASDSAVAGCGGNCKCKTAKKKQKKTE